MKPTPVIRNLITFAFIGGVVFSEYWRWCLGALLMFQWLLNEIAMPTLHATMRRERIMRQWARELQREEPTFEGLEEELASRARESGL